MPVLNYLQTEELLSRYGIAQAKTFASANPNAIAQASYSFEFPVVIKGMSSQILHKTEKKMIMLGLEDENEVRGACSTLSARAADQEIQIDHFLLQEQKKGVELIVGGKRDPSFGPVLLFGFGGIYAEMLKDFAVRVCPVDQVQAREMMALTKSGAFFSENGFRGMKASSDAVSDLLLRASKLMMENPKVVELDFNPVIASARDASVVDARIIVD